MNKRSALLASAGLVLTLVAGGLAVVIGITGPTISSGSPRTDTVEPRVRTVKRTITVRRQAKADAAQVVQLSASGDGSSSTEGLEGEDDGSEESYESEDEGSESEGPEHEGEHEDQDSNDD